MIQTHPRLRAPGWCQAPVVLLPLKTRALRGHVASLLRPVLFATIESPVRGVAEARGRRRLTPAVARGVAPTPLFLYIEGMSDPIPTYRACRTCGKWMPLQATSKQVYCSPECARENLRCPVCGRWFEEGSGVVNEAGEVCTSDCARTERRYDHLFKEQS